MVVVFSDFEAYVEATVLSTVAVLSSPCFSLPMIAASMCDSSTVSSLFAVDRNFTVSGEFGSVQRTGTGKFLRL